MKKIIQGTAVLIMLASIMTSCSKSNTAPAAANTVTPVEIVSSGTWKVGTLSQRGEDKTSQFSGYSFTFTKAGIVTAENSGVITNGTWSYTPSAVVYYGSTGSNASINIILGSEKPLSQLTKVWNIDSTATNASRLSLVSPEVNEGMKLEFLKR